MHAGLKTGQKNITGGALKELKRLFFSPRLLHLLSRNQFQRDAAHHSELIPLRRADGGTKMSTGIKMIFLLLQEKLSKIMEQNHFQQGSGLQHSSAA